MTFGTIAGWHAPLSLKADFNHSYFWGKCDASILDMKLVSLSTHHPFVIRGFDAFPRDDGPVAGAGRCADNSREGCWSFLARAFLTKELMQWGHSCSHTPQAGLCKGVSKGLHGSHFRGRRHVAAHQAAVLCAALPAIPGSMHEIPQGPDPTMAHVAQFLYY